jgi:hypothetical protein
MERYDTKAIQIYLQVILPLQLCLVFYLQVRSLLEASPENWLGSGTFLSLNLIALTLLVYWINGLRLVWQHREWSFRWLYFVGFIVLPIASIMASHYRALRGSS